MKNIILFLFLLVAIGANAQINFNTLPSVSTVTPTTPLPTVNSSGNWRKMTADLMRAFIMPRPVTRVAPTNRYVLGYVNGFDSLQYIPGGIMSQLPLGNVTIASDTSQWTITSLAGINFVNAAAGSGWVNRIQTSRSTTNFLTFKSGQTVTVGTDTTTGASLRWNTTGIYAKADSMFITPENLDSISAGEVLTVISKISNRAYVKFRPSSGGGGGSPTGSAGGDLTGTYPNPTIGNDKVISANVLDGTLVNADLASQTIDSNKIKNGVVTTVKIADDAVTAAKIGSGEVGSSELASTAVAAGSYTAANITVDADGRITSAANGSGGTNLLEVPIFLFIGESNSGGIALNSSATSNELAPRKEITIWNNAVRAFQTLDIGTNNLLAHTGLESYYGLTHGFELELANQIRDSFGLTYAYLLKAGQGGSIISQWDDGDPYQVTLENRIDSVTTALAARGQKPKWIIWVSLGINDAIASTSASTWETAVLSWFTRVRTLCGGGTSIPIVMTRIMRTNSSYQAIDDKIAEIAAEQDFVSAASITDATLLDANHWDYAGIKLISSRMAAITLDSFGLVGNFRGKDANPESEIVSVATSAITTQRRIDWETRTNTVDSGNGTLTLSGSLDAGAIGDTIDATQDFYCVTRWDATTITNNEAAVFALDDSTNTDYNWLGVRRYYIATFYQFGGTLYASVENAGTGSPTATNTGFTITANQWTRLLKSGNDVLLQTSSDSLSWTTRHTYTGALVGKTNLYTKGIFAVASGTKRIQNASIVTTTTSIPEHEYLNFTYAKVYSGSGSPEGVISAVVGSTFMRSDGGGGTSLYVKESGSSNTGWKTPYTTGNILSGSATLNFASTAAGAVTDLTITVTGAADGDVVSLSVPNASQTTTGSFSAWVSATNTVTVRYRIAALTGSEDPASGTFKVTVTK